MPPFKKILLIGAGGSIGKVVLEALLNEPSINLTILRRASSTAPVPSTAKVVTVSDAYTTEELKLAFTGQEAIVNCMTSLDVAQQFHIIDAAIAANVRRYIPSEYGLDNTRPEAQALNSVFRDKGRVQAYLRSKEDRIEWMAISCGMWLRWSMANDFLGMHLRERRFVFWDDGEGLFSCTTEENTALGLVNALVREPEATRNRNVFVSDFAISQRQLLAEIERQMGERWVTEKVDSYALIEEKQAAEAGGDQAASFALIETAFVTGRFGGHLEEHGEVWNRKLGLPEKSLAEVVSAALRANV